MGKGEKLRVGSGKVEGLAILHGCIFGSKLRVEYCLLYFYRPGSSI
jgi:hypothetical protein